MKDDDDIFTRRYATMWKGKDVLKSLLGTQAGYLKGKFATQNGRTLPKVADPLAPDPNVKKVQAFEAHQVPNLTAGADLETRQMLHVHQELGSGPSGRGLCLSSVSLSQVEATGGTWKTKVKKSYANNGTPFAGSDNLLVLVDLSLVPPGKELFYNLYRPEAQERAVAVRLKTNQGDFSDNAHAQQRLQEPRAVPPRPHSRFHRELERDRAGAAQIGR